MSTESDCTSTYVNIKIPELLTICKLIGKNKYERSIATDITGYVGAKILDTYQDSR